MEAKIFFLLLRFPLDGAADHLVCPESPFEDNKDVWTLAVKIKGAGWTVSNLTAIKIEAVEICRFLNDIQAQKWEEIISKNLQQSNTVLAECIKHALKVAQW